MVAILVITGLLLIYLEFFLPSAIMAIGGTLLLLASLLHFYIENPHVLPMVAFTACLLLALFASIRLALWHVKKEHSRSGLKHALCEQVCNGMTGKPAEVVSDLNPAGIIQIEGNEFPALSQSGLIERGSRVRIIGVEQQRFLVSLDLIER